MKIPETNTGAYYGNEDGQWQANGVVTEAGIVGSGDGYHHARVYPVPRGHVPTPGYVMAGAYFEPGAPYPPHAAQPDDFADYMWMENEEEFDKQVMQQLEEEALMEQCIEAMLEDEQRERNRPNTNGHNQIPTTSMDRLSLEQAVSRSTLNPLAAEFVPTGSRLATTQDKEIPAQVSATADLSQDTKKETETAESPDKEDPVIEDSQDSSEDLSKDKSQDKRPQDIKKDTKLKQEVKKTKSDAKKKPQAVKSEPKVTTTKKEVAKKELKTSKSNDAVDDSTTPVIEAPSATETPKSQPSVTSIEEISAPSGPKPINCAAAAKANKPKKATTPPATDKPISVKSVEKIEKVTPKEKTKEKVPVKTDKTRKNSATK